MLIGGDFKHEDNAEQIAVSCGVPWQRRYRPWGNPATPETRGFRATSTETRLYDPTVRCVGPSLWSPRRGRMRVHDTREAISPSILSR